MVKHRSRLAVAGLVVALGWLMACDSRAEPPTPVALVPTVAPSPAASVTPPPTPQPTATTLPTATNLPQPTATLVPTPLPTAGPLPAGWQWYENTTFEPAEFRIAYPKTWTVWLDIRGSRIQPTIGIVYQATFQSPETGSSVVLDIWELRGRRDEDLLQWVNTDPSRSVFDRVDEPLTYNATVLGRPAVFHYHPARWGTNDFAVTLFVTGQHRYRATFHSGSSPVTEAEPQIYRTMLESLQVFGQPDGLTEIPTGWEGGAGLVIDTRPIETAAGELVDLAAAPLLPLGGLAGIIESAQAEPHTYRIALVTDTGETYIIRRESWRVHFRGQPIDSWCNANVVNPPPQPGERVTVTGRLIAPNEVVAGSITIERDGVTQTWCSETLIEIAPYWGEGNGFPTNAVVSAVDVPHLWLRGPLQTMVGLLTDDAEPPLLPAAWQPYADRTALVYGPVNPENRHMEVKEVYVQDGPCDVTPSTTHCPHWLQILPEIPQSD